MLMGVVICGALAPAHGQTSFGDLARSAGTPQIPGLKIVYLTPLGNPAQAPWKNIIVHQTEGPAGSARSLAAAQERNPSKRGVTLWVETDGAIYWATPEQIAAWLVLVRFLQERYGIPAENVYAHNWIDYKDHRYCEGCELARNARALNHVPGRAAASAAGR